MRLDIAKLFHLASKKFKKIPTEENWPKSWKTVYYKIYPRLPKIDLSAEPLKEILQKPYSYVSQNRETDRNFNSERQFNREEISFLLKYSCGIIREKNGRKIRASPSGGAMYPIEAYIILPNGGGESLRHGLYHYNVKNHFLERLKNEIIDKNRIGELFTYDFVKESSLIIVLTGKIDLMLDKYGTRGYRHILLEAGHIGQSLVNLATLLGVNVCPLSGTRDENLEDYFNIKNTDESVVYAVAFSKK